MSAALKTKSIVAATLNAKPLEYYQILGDYAYGTKDAAELIADDLCTFESIFANDSPHELTPYVLEWMKLTPMSHPWKEA